MTEEEAKKEIIDMANALQLIPNTPKGKAVLMAIKALEKEPCEDCISRKDTLKKFKQIYFDNDTVIRCAELILGSMPPVTPQPKTGHWIIEKWNNKEHYSCSSCQHVVDYEPCYHYCPYCGAKMIEPQESEDKE